MEDRSYLRALTLDMLRSRGVRGLPRDFEWHPDGKKLYFLSSGGDAELYYVDVDGNQKCKYNIAKPTSLTINISRF